MQIFPELYTGTTKKLASVNVQKPINKAAPFSSLFNSFAEHIQNANSSSTATKTSTTTTTSTSLSSASATESNPAGVGGIAGKIVNAQGMLVAKPGTIVNSAASSVSSTATKSSSSGGATKNSSNPASEYKLTKEDFSRLKQRLLQQGMKEQDVAAIEKQLDSGEGLTWKQFLQQVGEKFGFSAEDMPATYGAEQKKALNDMFTTLGFTPAESASLISDLSQNKASSVMSKMSEKLAALDPESETGVTNTQLCALAAAMKLSQASVDRLDAKMGGETQALSKTDVAAGLELIAKETNTSKIGSDKKIEELKTVLGAGMQDAINRAELQKLADNKDSKEVQNAQVLIQDSARKRYGSEASEQIESSNGDAKDSSDERQGAQSEDANATLGDGKGKTLGETKTGVTPDANAEVKEDAKPDVKPEAKPEAKLDAKLADSGQTAPQGVEGKAVPETAQQAQAAAGRTSAETGAPQLDPNAQQHAEAQKNADAEFSSKERSANHKQQSGSDSAPQNDASHQAAQQVAEALKGKVEVKNGSSDGFAGAMNVATSAATGASSSATLTNHAATSQTTQTGQTSQAFDAQQVLRTVQNGVLSNLNDGSSKLSLQLEPENLGKITLILQVKNQELSALIKTESEDVTRALSQNMDQLRQSLEEQGLKVEKLDVQTQLNQDMNRNSMTPDQHNQAQEQEMHNKMMSSWKFLRSQSQDEDALAHEMQNIPQQVKNSQQGVDIFA